ncbi:MAG: hypothetical protein JSS82_11350 [Bacteroidetes bacterium]|nr:hypothetical protein [Bacteroidota bacterium]
MKTSRLLVYAAVGMIAGLLIENRALLTQKEVRAKAREWKTKMAKKMRKLQPEEA